MSPTMERETLPLIILGGRDRGTTVLPEAGRNKHLLRGYKAVDLEIGGRPLILTLVERLRACGLFEPMVIAGPRAVYEPVVEGVRVLDTDSTFGGNLKASVEALRAEFPSRLLAVTTCDILPDPAELARAIDDFERHRPRDFWMPLIRSPERLDRLGESAWKPKYAVVPEGEDRPVNTLPGHLIIVDPAVLRLSLIYRVFEVAYRTRNRPIAYRFSLMVRTFFSTLVWGDLRRLFSLRRPHLTWTMISNGYAITRRFRGGGGIPQAELEERVSRLWVRHRHRRRHPERRGRVPILDTLSLAKDIDTEEEAREAARAMESAGD
jgi:hypothetical protein